MQVKTFYVMSEDEILGLIADRIATVNDLICVDPKEIELSRNNVGNLVATYEVSV